MTLDETINEAKITAALYEKEACKCIQHGGSFYEEKAKALRESAKEFEQVTEWLEELKAYREAHGKADRPQGEWIPPIQETVRTIQLPPGKLINWQYCRDPNDINKAIKEKDPNWEGLHTALDIISITYDTNHGCYAVFWITGKRRTDMFRKSTPPSPEIIRIRARKNEIAQKIENEKRRKIKPSELVGNKEKK